MHDLFDERFFSTRPEWHGLGEISEIPTTATEAWSRMTPYSIRMADLLISRPGKKPVPSRYRAIAREPVPDDPIERIFGVIGPDYILIEPQEICEIFDAAVQTPIQTLGALGKGETLFMSVHLPDLNIRGDPVENYLVLISPYFGNAALRTMITPVRPVCRNTLRMASYAATEVYRVTHDPSAQKHLSAWMSGMMTRAKQRTETLQQAFEMFVSYQPSTKIVPNIVERVYSYPEAPAGDDVDVELAARRIANYEATVVTLDRSREAVQELFDGRGTGLEVPACRGTGWGLYNAVAEWENWRHTTNDQSRGESVLVGARGAVIEKAYKVVYDYASRAAKRQGTD